MSTLAQRIYAHRGLPYLLQLTRVCTVLMLLVFLAATNWLVAVLERRGLVTEAGDLALNMAALGVAAMVALAIGRFVRPLVEEQAGTLARALADERAARRELEAELARREAFIEQANHHLRTPVTVVYGMAQLLAVRGDEMDAADRGEFRRVVLANATKLKGIVEELSGFLEEQVESASIGPRD